jgi:hypothetical protein
VLALLGETTKATALEGPITTGLVRLRVAFTVTLRYAEVAFLSWKKVPPAVVAVTAGSVRFENPPLVI